MRARAPLSVALAALVAIGCSPAARVEPGADASPPPAGSERLATRTVYHDPGSAIEESRREILRDEASWEALWREAHANRIGSEPAPEIDFDRSMVVVATMGRRSTGGYSIEIRNVFAGDAGLLVEVVETSPGEGCVVTQSLTAPAVAVEVDRRSGEAQWFAHQETSTC